MKRMTRLIAILLGLLLLITGLLYFSQYRYILKAARIVYFNGYTTAFIDDHREFPNRVIEKGAESTPWPLHKDYNQARETPELEALHQTRKTAAYLIIKEDSIWFEKYYQGYHKDSRTNSFSIAKSVVVALLGKAMEEGYITGLDQSVSDYFPRFHPSLKIGDLASMASGLNWNENYYNPFGMTAKAYYAEGIDELILNLEVTQPPGKEFQYLSGNTQLLAMVIRKATGKPLAQYLSERLWKPLGMRRDALWQLDKEGGTEKAYCCIATNARDLARMGSLFKDAGRWRGKQLLDPAFVQTVITRRFRDSPQYGYGFWLSDHRNKRIFYMRGVRGQYVIVIPEDDLIIVRLGRKYRRPLEKHQVSPDFFRYIDETYQMLENSAGTL